MMRLCRSEPTILAKCDFGGQKQEEPFMQYTEEINQRIAAHAAKHLPDESYYFIFRF